MIIRIFLLSVIIAIAGCKSETIIADRTYVVEWDKVSSWPGIVEPQPIDAKADPDFRATVFILDDSGSMGADIIPAKQAILTTLDRMEPTEKIAVMALNDGLILDFKSVNEAKSILPNRLMMVDSQGGTPLTRSVVQAREILRREAANSRGYGTFTMIVITDGAADSVRSLYLELVEIGTTTPIVINGIGIGTGENHTLNISGLTGFVPISNVDGLADQLSQAVAERSSYQPLTTFEAEP